VLDNARAHHTLANKQLAASLDIELMFLPPYTPELNSIEALWAVIKGEFKQRALARNLVRMKQEEFTSLLQGCLDDITPAAQSRAALLNNRAFLHQCLGDLIEVKLELAGQGLEAGADHVQVASDDLGPAEFGESWPPNGDPFPSD
jgi:hypothetical protein